MRTAFTICVLTTFLASTAIAGGKDDKHKGGEQKPAPAKKPDAPKKAEPAKPAESKPAAPVSIGAPVDGALSVVDLQGKPVTLESLRGKVTVIEFWSLDPMTAGWDAKTAKIVEEYGKKGVAVLLVDEAKGDVDAGDKPYGRISEHAQKAALSCPIAIDKSGALAERLGATATGEVCVLDAKGVLQYRGAIDDDAKGDKGDKRTPYLKNALDAVLAGKAPSPTTTPPSGAPIAHESHDAKPPAKK